MRLRVRTVAHRDPFRSSDLLNEHVGRIVACDFYIEGAELGVEIPGGYEIDGVMNVDHHAPSRRMMQNISSTNLAIAQIDECGHPSMDTMVFVSHTDCDSVLSAAIMSGELEPDPKFGEAAIAADHTGAPNGIADVLQSLDTLRDFYFSLRNLRKFLNSEPLDFIAQPHYRTRMHKRDAAEKAVANGKVQQDGPIAHGILDMKIDGEFFPPNLPDAALIVLFTPRTDSHNRDVKIRLGRSAPSGASLHHLRIKHFDPAFAGRWNAGSNRRNGGTSMDPDDYVRNIAYAVREEWGL